VEVEVVELNMVLLLVEVVVELVNVVKRVVLAVIQIIMIVLPLLPDALGEIRLVSTMMVCQGRRHG